MKATDGQVQFGQKQVCIAVNIKACCKDQQSQNAKAKLQ